MDELTDVAAWSLGDDRFLGYLKYNDIVIYIKKYDKDLDDDVVFSKYGLCHIFRRYLKYETW
jgi:hypothetical protein